MTSKLQVSQLFTKLKKFTGKIEHLIIFSSIQQTLFLCLKFAMYFESQFCRYEIKEYNPCSKIAHKFLKKKKRNKQIDMWFSNPTAQNIPKRNEKNTSSKR